MTRLTIAPFLIGAVAALVLAVACSEENSSARCSEQLPLYDLRDAAAHDADPLGQTARTLADEGCITLPAPGLPGSNDAGTD